MEKPNEKISKKITLELTEEEATTLVQALQGSSMYDNYAKMVETQQDGEVIVKVISALSEELKPKEEKKPNPPIQTP